MARLKFPSSWVVSEEVQLIVAADTCPAAKAAYTKAAAIRPTTFDRGVFCD